MPRLRRGGGIASSSSLVLLVLVLLYIVYIVCDSASELERWTLLPFSFLGFSCPSLFLVFLNLLFLGTCYIFFASVGTFSGSFIFLFFMYLIFG